MASTESTYRSNLLFTNTLDEDFYVLKKNCKSDFSHYQKSFASSSSSSLSSLLDFRPNSSSNDNILQPDNYVKKVTLPLDNSTYFLQTEECLDNTEDIFSPEKIVTNLFKKYGDPTVMTTGKFSNNTNSEILNSERHKLSSNQEVAISMKGEATELMNNSEVLCSPDSMEIDQQGEIYEFEGISSLNKDCQDPHEPETKRSYIDRDTERVTCAFESETTLLAHQNYVSTSVNANHEDAIPKLFMQSSASSDSSNFLSYPVLDDTNDLITTSTSIVMPISTTVSKKSGIIPPSEKFTDCTAPTGGKVTNAICSDEVFKCTLVNTVTNKPCFQEFSRPYDLTRHQNTVHAKKRSVFRCLECIRTHGEIGYQKTFSRLDALTRHIKLKHEGLPTEKRQELTQYARKNLEYIMT
ncbi:hypothetical protein KAFR_0C00960 [Kazachstania africana CBS 2517]|uniref:C2H2-type domain-containing protein n=1 Tax=Kazachstania africana (strain ATCC 22294 / BCRC 22015 / CBS 2517 / CECT 1963 / NBRC 1671 / NRRL Y-8276) TaxID=1071382 RepID=H2ARU1_KAZAF|nr:hypothetical protein KAFR_0C00960 [Kazachstania africana CBS 2517]CCF57091.1 hypothetical protein KAFR_0C00960 [Kazachstania africana CBS 2517]